LAFSTRLAEIIRVMSSPKPTSGGSGSCLGVVWRPVMTWSLLEASPQPGPSEPGCLPDAHVATASAQARCNLRDWGVASTREVNSHAACTLESPPSTPLIGTHIKPGDSVLQSWRIAVATPYIPHAAHVLDIGCGDGALFRALGSRIASGVGIDAAPVPRDHGSFRFIQGHAPEALPEHDRYDAITLLAVLEHIPPDAQRDLAAACRMLVRDPGRVVCTVPSAQVDSLIHLGQRLAVLDGIEAHEHHGFVPADTLPLFTNAGFVLRRAQRFQLGLNNLFVFAPDGDRSSSSIRS
jgi:SAM-dependent methyltransferase